MKWLGYFALGCYVVLAVAFIGLRYWVLPNIDRWRAPLQNELSSMLSTQVELGRLSAEWAGPSPRLHVTDVVLRDETGRVLLNIPSLNAVIAWRGLLVGRLQFTYLHTDGVELTVHRDADDRIRILGNEAGATGGHAAVTPRDDSSSAFLQWLAGQGDVRVSNASIRWLDASRGAPVLAFDDVALAFGQDGDAHHFSMQARPPASLGRSFALQARVTLQHADGRLPSLRDVSGLIHVGVENMQPSAWGPWLGSHSLLQQGEVSWKAWQEVHDGIPQRHVTRASVKNGVWLPMEGVRVAAVSALFHLDGPWSELHEIWSGESVPGAGDPVVRVAAKVDGLYIDADGHFAAPLAFNTITMRGDLSHDPDAGFRLAADQLQVRNADMDLEARGAWQAHGAGQAGLIDLEGEFNWAQLSAIVRYLPNEVDEDARLWLQHGLLAGTLKQASLRLQGDLFHFPFGDHPEAGDFKVGGRIEGAVVDYAPAALVGAPGWPRLEALNGRAELHKVDLQIWADTLQMRLGGDTQIALRDTHARIPNIENQAVLSVEGHGQAEAAAYLTLLRDSPLAVLLDGLFSESEGKGTWDVPISLTIPLFDTDATKVAGSVLFKDAELQLADDLPILTQLNGRVDFTEEGVIAHEVKAQALGGPLTIGGGVGPGTKGLDFTGTMQADALDRLLDGRLQGRAQGGTPYQLRIQRNAAGALGVSFQSTLEGMALDLPAPLAKAAPQRWPLRVQWTPVAGKKPAVLDIQLNDMLSAQLLHRGAAPNTPFFYSGAVNIQGKARAGEAGLYLDVIAPRVDIDAWRGVVDALAGPEAPTTAREATRNLFPPLRDLRLQAESAQALGTELNHFTITARRPKGERWRVDVSSTETAGTLFWQERQGRIQGEVEAHFARLAVGNGTARVEGRTDDAGRPSKGKNASGSLAQGTTSTGKGASATTWEFDGEFDIPAIQLRVDRLRLYGHEVGAVSLVGVNEAQGRRWKLQDLQVSSPHASLKGQGVWQLDGPQRGLRLQADALFDDLGAYIDQLGFPDLIEGGHGSIRGHVEWRGIPKKFERAGLHGDLEVDLAKGRFVSVSSRSGRLLELLSLQSLERLAKLDWNPAGLMRQGFPFDTLQGHITADSGVMHSENYRVTSPVASIVMAGDVDLVQERLDVYAVVVPTLDVSAAAIAAGIAVNPIVGLGAFLTQWLLKNPLSKAMTVEYRVRGSFDEPQVAEISTK